MTDNLAPAEGRTDLDIPGADHADLPSESPEGPLGIEQPTRDIGQPVADSPEIERPDELADRVGVGMPSPADHDRPDVLPDVEVPDEQA
jgi:hypothetical protein